mmetsp:Transcript_21855/g.52844  ORF Transcript_21855/g.52844 Transcript_21855/m.52844 type:complete len:101 (+) Transcript_21855:1061-1363(+)
MSKAFWCYLSDAGDLDALIQKKRFVGSAYYAIFSYIVKLKSSLGNKNLKVFLMLQKLLNAHLVVRIGYYPESLPYRSTVSLGAKLKVPTKGFSSDRTEAT